MKKKFLITCANYYEDISSDLLLSAKKLLPKNSIVKIISVPGVFEIPISISKNIKKFDAFIALGCVIKGETPHFDFISQATTDAIMRLSIESKKPIGNGIITCLNMAQAKARSKKGSEATKAVLSILSQK
jgi:6,7-dimethyl-8-ribityllumazine synthase